MGNGHTGGLVMDVSEEENGFEDLGLKRTVLEEVTKEARAAFVDLKRRRDGDDNDDDGDDDWKAVEGLANRVLEAECAVAIRAGELGQYTRVRCLGTVKSDLWDGMQTLAPQTWEGEVARVAAERKLKVLTLRIHGSLFELAALQAEEAGEEQLVDQRSVVRGLLDDGIALRAQIDELQAAIGGVGGGMMRMRSNAATLELDPLTPEVIGQLDLCRAVIL